MFKSNSTARTKPNKPYPDFPLFPHATKRWAKKIRGKLHYFGPWADPDAALQKYLEQKEALHSDREPRPDNDGLTVKELCNRFLNHKQALVESGELSRRMWEDYQEATVSIVKKFGKGQRVDDLTTDDFAALRVEMAKRWGPVRLGNVIQRVRSTFKYAFDTGLIPVPMRFGPGFARPSKKTLRLKKAKEGPKLFGREEILTMLMAAPPHLEGMILLGINCGFGNADCGRLPLSALDLDGGWLSYPRPKTGIPRRCKLWPETVEAIQDTLANRPQPKSPEAADLLFITKYVHPWAKDNSDNPITNEMRKLLNALSIKGRRNFYTLRHTFRTVADQAKDQPAADQIMGHESAHMSTHYREGIGDDRLLAVANHVRDWLFGDTKVANV